MAPRVAGRTTQPNFEFSRNCEKLLKKTRSGLYLRAIYWGVHKRTRGGGYNGGWGWRKDVQVAEECH